MSHSPSFVSVIIVHYNDPEYLLRCVNSIIKSTYQNIELIIVDNNSDNTFCPFFERSGLEVNYIKNIENLGFAGGCNVGIKAAKGNYVFILNNDIEIESNCIKKLVEFADLYPEIALLQPKMLDFHNRRLFHSGAAGGLIDILGYPFARGRILGSVEEDVGQYDNPIEIFWASGAAMFARKEALQQVGLLDQDFFLYMEEIDLAWRIHLLGYRSVYIPTARIYHIGCPNLDRNNMKRIYFDHRNNVVMLVKNLSTLAMFLLVPIRITLEVVTIVAAIVLGQWRRAFAVARALGYIGTRIPALMTKRKRVQRLRMVSDAVIFSKMYRGSIILQYFLFKKTRVSDFPIFHPIPFPANSEEKK